MSKNIKKPECIPLFCAHSKQMKQLRDMWINLTEKEKVAIEIEARENLKRIIDGYKSLFDSGVV